MAPCKVKIGLSTWKYVTSSMKQKMGEYPEKINECLQMLLINTHVSLILFYVVLCCLHDAF